MRPKSKPGWSNETPIELGSYWFYGDAHSSSPVDCLYKATLYRVTVHQGGDSILRVADGSFMSDDAYGLWQKIPEIQIPMLEKEDE